MHRCPALIGAVAIASMLLSATLSSARQLWPVTTHPANDIVPSWFGNSIAFESNRSGNRDIWVIPAPGGLAQQITTHAAGDDEPTWSPDGQWIAFTSDRSGNNDIWVVPATGEPPALQITTDVADDDSPPAWSPDGQWIAFSSNRSGNNDIWIIPSFGGAAIQVTTDPGYDSEPSWSPDGSSIAFESDRSGNLDIWVIPATGGVAQQITTHTDTDVGPAWSPNNGWIAYTSDRSGNYDVWVIPADGGTAQQVTTDPTADGNPDWSSDGDAIAFASDRSPGVPDSANIWVSAATEINALEITFDKREGSGSVFRYDLFAMYANKDNATTCEITMPSGTYAFIDVGGAFRPEQSFIDDHTDMSFAEFVAAIAGGWTLTWDSGSPTQTIATISFGAILESDFWLVPTITTPVDGAQIKIPGDPNPPGIEWTYDSGLPACDIQLDDPTVNLFGPAGVEIESGELPCDVLSWTPSLHLSAGSWLCRVANVNSNNRAVPDGLVITGDTWILENWDWLSLRSVDTAQISVVRQSFNFADYYPLVWRNTWSYEDEFNPVDTFVDSVFGFRYVSGQPAVSYGHEGGLQLFCWNDQSEVTWYGWIADQDTNYLTQNLVLGSMEDGAKFLFNPQSPDDSVFVRVWDALDPIAASVYGIDPAYGDLIVWAAYDADKTPNIQNAVIESNLPPGVLPPPGGVTDLDWYQIGVGLTVYISVDAVPGTLDAKYVLVNYDQPTGIDPPDMRGRLSISAYPSPFNPSTTIVFSLPEPGDVVLEVFDASGRRVSTLARAHYPAGQFSVPWNAQSRGNILVSGVYFARLSVNGKSSSTKLVLLK